jgi:hypothetical protein
MLVDKTPRFGHITVPIGVPGKGYFGEIELFVSSQNLVFGENFSLF